MRKKADESETATEMNAAPLALRPRDAARALGIGERLLWSKTIAGEIPAARIGRAVVYPVHMLKEWLETQTARGNESRTH